MRLRVAAVVLFVVAIVASARAETIRILRYEASYDNGQHSAWCVVPGTVKNSNGARYICYFITPGKGKTRDNTRAGGSLQTVDAPDASFTQWLQLRIPRDAACNLNAVAQGADFPPKDAVEVMCRGALYNEETLTSGTTDTFISDVHKKVEATLKDERTATNAPASITQSDPLPMTRTNAERQPSAPAQPVVERNAPPAAQEQKIEQKKEQKIEQEKVKPARDWTIPLLLFIVALAVLLVLERMVHFIRRRLLLKSAVSVKAADSIEDAAIYLEKQRDEMKASLEETTRQRDDAITTLAGIDKQLHVTPGVDRSVQIAALLKYEQELVRLAGGAESAAAAVKKIEATLGEREAIAQLLVGKQDAVRYLTQCNALVDALSTLFWSNTSEPDLVQVVVEELESDIKTIYARVNEGGPTEPSARAALGTIAQALERLREQHEHHQKTLNAVRNFVSAQWPQIVSDSLDTTITTLEANMRKARTAAASVGPADGNIDAVITDLAAKVLREREDSRDTKDVLHRIREYIELPGDEVGHMNGVISAELGTPNRVLRLVLAAAVPALRNSVAALPGEEILRVLRVAEVVDSLDAFLGRLAKYRGAELWEIGIQNGFGQGWLHHLFRAEAVLRTYFLASRLADVSDVLTAVAWAFRYAAAASGYAIDRVHLLAVPSTAIDPKHEPPHEFRANSDIRTRVQAVLETQHDGGFVVDVDSVGISGNNVSERSTVVLAKRIDWVD